MVVVSRRYVTEVRSRKEQHECALPLEGVKPHKLLKTQPTCP